MSPQPFVHLHLHSQYSLLDGAIKIDPLFERVKALGMPAAALTDHGNLFGAIEFYEAAQSWGHRILVIGNPLATDNFFYFRCKQGNRADPAGQRPDSP